MEHNQPGEILGATGRDEAVGVGEPREDPDLARVLKLETCSREAPKQSIITSIKNFLKKKRKSDQGRQDRRGTYGTPLSDELAKTSVAGE